MTRSSAQTSRDLLLLDQLLGVDHRPWNLDPEELDEAGLLRARMVQAVRRKGVMIGGGAPYGYRIVRDPSYTEPAVARRGELTGRLQRDNAQANVVQEVFARFAAGAGQTQIARWLNASGIHTPTGHSSRGWTADGISSLLDNPRYTGYQFWRPHSRRREQDLPGHLSGTLIRSEKPAHPTIISISDFLLIAQRRAHPAPSRASRTSTTDAAFYHRVTCGVCGRTMNVETLKGRVRYRCRAIRGPHGHAKNFYITESRLLGLLSPSGQPVSPAKMRALAHEADLRLTYQPNAQTVEIRNKKAGSLQVRDLR